MVLLEIESNNDADYDAIAFEEGLKACEDADEAHELVILFLNGTAPLLSEISKGLTRSVKCYYITDAPISITGLDVLFPVLSLQFPTDEFILINVNKNYGIRREVVHGSSYKLHRLFHDLRESLNNNNYSTGRRVVKHIRRHLKDHSSSIAKLLDDRLSQIHRQLEAICLFFSNTTPATLAELLSSNYIDDITQFIGRHNSYIYSLRESSSYLKSQLRQHADFVGSGLKFSQNFDSQATNGRRLEIFDWLSVYFLRLSSFYIGSGNSSAALIALVRCIESYCIAMLMENNRITWSGKVFVFASGSKVMGAGQLWDSARNNINSSKLSPLEKSLSIAQIIELRNHCILGHGVHNYDKTIIELAIAVVPKVIDEFEYQRGSPIHKNTRIASTYAVAPADLSELTSAAWQTSLGAAAWAP